MADQTITVPDFKFTGMYYPHILRTLRQWRRVYASEITSEDDHEPFEQLLRAYALASHISNVLTDQVALEHYLRTAKLLSSVRDRLQLIDYTLAQAAPAEVEAILALSKIFTTRTMIIGPPQQHMTQFSTEQTEVDEEIVFEWLDLVGDGLFVERTDQIGACFVETQAPDPDQVPTPAQLITAVSSFTDQTTAINNVGTGSFTAWVAPHVNEAIYFGHADVMFDRLDLVVTTGSAGIQGVWEYYDEEYFSTNPDAVVNNGSTLTFHLNTLLSGLNRTGAYVRVTYLPTGAYEDIYSTFTTPNNLITSSILGQTTDPSTDAQDYSVGCLWAPLPDAVDATSGLQTSGKVTWTLPQTADYRWSKVLVNGFLGFLVRFRITVVSSPTCPIIDSADISNGSQALSLVVTQGRTVSDEPLGSSNGLADQTFKLKQTPILDNTLIIEVSNVVWDQVDNFMLSRPQDLHFTVFFDDDNEANVKFGNGINGTIPQMGVNNIAAFYRIGGTEDGNIPADSLTQNTSGLAYVASVTNPRPGVGWKIADGGDDADLARLKIAGPASLRTLGRAINPGDLEALSVAYVDTSGSSPVVRAYAIEESYGPKTMEAVVVGAGGNYLSVSQLEEFSLYLNGDRTEVPPTRGKIVANHEAIVVNYERRVIPITAIVYGGVLTEVQNALSALLSPLALQADGTSYQWDFGGEVPLSVIIETIHAVSTSIRKVTLVAPTSDIILRHYELPWPGVLTITVVS